MGTDIAEKISMGICDATVALRKGRDIEILIVESGNHYHIEARTWVSIPREVVECVVHDVAGDVSADYVEILK